MLANTQCIYCNEWRKRSEEHIIANWVQSILHPQSNWHWNVPDITVSPGEHQRAQGPIGNRRFNRVCQRCNIGWMNDLQKLARPILAPLIVGDWTELSNQHLQSLSSWISMSVLNIDATDVGHSALKRDRRFYYIHKRAPPRWNIWIGMASGTLDFVIYKDSMEIGTISGRPRNEKNASITTIRLGRFFAHIAALPEGQFQFSPERFGDVYGAMPISPNPGSYFENLRLLPILMQDDLDVLRDALPQHMKFAAGRLASNA